MYSKRNIFLLSIVCILISTHLLYSQIEINETNTKILFTPGNTLGTYLIPANIVINIGDKGEGNLYDLTDMPLTPTDSFHVYSVSEVPELVGHYPNDAFVLGTAPEVESLPFSIMQFDRDTLFILGSVALYGDNLVDTLDYIHYTPPKPSLPFPTVYGDNWSYDGIRSDSLFDENGFFIETDTSHYINNYTIDGSDSLRIFNRGFDCLREKSETSFHVDQGIYLGYKKIEFYAEGLWFMLFTTLDAPETGNITTTHEGLLLLSDAFSDVEETKDCPTAYALDQNYPNPFNPATKISYFIPVSDLVTLEILNVRGEKITTLVNEIQPTGTYTVDFDASRFASGIYFYMLTIGEKYKQTKKMVLMR